MMGKTHILGGAVALAAVALATGETDHFPVWAYGAAGIAALIPDADNHDGSMLNRTTLLPFKILTVPLWWGAPHRGRTHSIVGAVAFAGLMWLWLMGLNMALAAGGSLTGVAADIMLPALVAGYVSHLVLDLVNIPGMQLLWPIPARIYFPPWRAHGLMVFGRFATGTRHEATAWLALSAFAGWFLISQAGGIVEASAGDESIGQFFRGLVNLLVGGVRGLIDALS